ncbi:hypothetical protein RA210_U250007 [Rubrivivax sp. A210]|uniref:hypothetical protein n=1 Tax=Rubrivivax sp. A210 TaxID=2772301 RepID=UPI001918B95A|nr:hypothetical protein [Rubrivivax sp. A210]CAD5372908.1 hypothetical protein RA210_U250007 [Rubrivivax sp. A210]
MKKFSVHFEMWSPDEVTTDNLAKLAELLFCGFPFSTPRLLVDQVMFHELTTTVGDPIVFNKED